MKFCKKCNTNTERYSNGECITCRKASNYLWFSKNRDKARACSSAWKAANKEKCRLSKKAYVAANREKVKATYDAWCAANPERVKALNEKWRAANPEKVKAMYAAWKAANPEVVAAHHRNRRAKLRNSGGSHTAEDIKQLKFMQRNRCACCKADISIKFHVDHKMPLALGGGNDKYNLQLLCPSCNMQKRDKHPIDFMQKKGFLL